MRYWQEVNGDKTQLIVVSNEAVYAQRMANAIALNQIEQLRAGKSPATLFGEEATHVVLRATSRVQNSRGDDDIEFTVREGKDSTTVDLSIDDERIRNEVFDAIEDASQDRFQRYEDQYNRPRAAFGALLALSVIGFLTKVMASAAATIQARGGYEAEGSRRGAKQLFAWLLELLGSTGVIVIGSLLAALTLWLLVLRLRNPPYMRILQPKPYSPQPAIITGIKYAALIGAWVLLMPYMLR